MTTKAELQKENEMLKSLCKTTGLYIGAEAGTVKEVRLALMDILACGMDQKTIRCAIKHLDKLCSVNNATISDCTIHVGQ